MKIIATISLIVLSTNLFGQTFDVTAGVNFSKFYEIHRYDPGHYTSTYDTRPGYLVRFGLNNVYFGKLKTRINITVENYGGYINVSDGSPAGSFGTKGDIRKTNLSLGFLPIVLTLFDSLRFSSGITLSGLIHENVDGAYHYNAGGRSELVDIEDYSPYNAPLVFGYRAGLANTIKLGLKLSITIQYTFDFGLSREFAEFPWRTRSMRHGFAVGIQKRKPDTITPAFN
ncbi:MAG: hypothetical protein ACI9JN_001925 [Bacteroidia bacterium]|jgi:hypothetical protein